MKKILALVLCVVMVMSFASMASAATETITYDFKDLAVGEAFDDAGALAAFQAATTDTQLVSVNVTNVYAGADQGTNPLVGKPGYLKLGTSKKAGSIVLQYAEGVKITKVDVYCHDWFAKSDSYPTNSNKISVNNSEAVLLPYTTDSTVDVVSFTIEETNKVQIDVSLRGYISKIVVYTEVADAPAEDTPPTGDMIAVALATLAISGAGIAVLAKKKEY